MNQLAIALSTVLSFFSGECLGLLSGGMISGGYLALYIQSPLRLASTLCCAFAVYLIVLLLQKIVIIYGRRRFMACILLSFSYVILLLKIIPTLNIPFDIRAVGYIIPGLIANDMLKQGVVKTLLSLSLVTLLTKILMLLAVAVL